MKHETIQETHVLYNIAFAMLQEENFQLVQRELAAASII